MCDNVLSAEKKRELCAALHANERGVIRHPMHAIHFQLILNSKFIIHSIYIIHGDKTHTAKRMTRKHRLTRHVKHDEKKITTGTHKCTN